MRTNQQLILNIREKIEDFLNSRKLVSDDSVEKILSNPYRHSYFSVVTNKNNQRFFLKIRTRAIDWEKETFKTQYTIAKIIQQNPLLSLSQYVPKLIDGGIGELDFLMYEYLEAKNMGSRTDYDVIKLDNNDLPQVISLAKALLDFPISFLPQNFSQRKSAFYKQWVAGSNYEKDTQFKKLINENWPFFDQEANSFSHGDFKPNNLIRTQDRKLFLVDFEQASISNPYSDIASLWAYAIRKPDWRKQLIKTFINELALSEGQKHFLKINMLIHSLSELKILKTKKSIDLQRKYVKERELLVEKLKGNVELSQI